MKFKIPMEGGDDDIDMAPMIDMVFLLLIFFMVSSQLTQMERVPVLLPVAEESKVPKEARDRQTITVRPTDDGAEVVDIFMNLQTVDLDEFTTKIGNLYTLNENLKVYIRADKRVKYKHIKELMQACASVGIVDVIFATYESGN